MSTSPRHCQRRRQRPWPLTPGPIRAVWTLIECCGGVGRAVPDELSCRRCHQNSWAAIQRVDLTAIVCRSPLLMPVVSQSSRAASRAATCVCCRSRSVAIRWSSAYIAAPSPLYVAEWKKHDT